jgi:hypothetical protein
MSQPHSTSFAARFLQRRPELRAKVLASSDFQAWRSQFKTVVVDGVTYYVVGGDMLKDEDELILEWARRSGMVSEDAIIQQHREESR